MKSQQHYYVLLTILKILGENIVESHPLITRQVFNDENVPITIAKASVSNTDAYTGGEPEGESKSGIADKNGASTKPTFDIISRKRKRKSHNLYEHIDREALEKSCSEAKECPSSDEYWIVCGSDDISYQNLGVLACAQRCKHDLKFKAFGPCKNSKPMPPPIFPTLSTSPTRKPNTRLVFDQLAHETDIKKEEILEYLKTRIKSRYDHLGWPPEVEVYCRNNPWECPYGFDPSINPGVYIIPSLPYQDSDDIELQRQFA